MKYLNLFFTFLMAAFTLVACGGDEEELIEVSVTPNTLEFTTQGGQQSVTVQGAAANQVSVSANGEWYSMTVVPNNSTSCYVRVKVDVNKDFTTRHAEPTVSVDGKSYTFKINQEAVPEPVKPDDSVVAAAMAVSRAMGLGWNLGNQLDAQITWGDVTTPVANETCWGNPLCTQATFDGLKAKGFQSVRIPVTWQGHIGEAPNYTIDDEWMSRVVEVAGYAKKAGLKAIINLHHDEGGGSTKPNECGWLDIKTLAYNPTANTEVEKKLAAVWTQIATRFKDEGDWLIFESMNEIQDGGWGWGQSMKDGGKQYACLNHWQQVFVDAVRSTGGQNADRWLCVVGYAQNPQLTRDNLVLPTDPVNHSNRLIVAVHSYDPFDFCTEGKVGQWGHTGNVASSKNGEETLEKTFKALKETYIDKGIPVIIGEFGCVNRSDAKERQFQKYFLEYFVRCGWTYGIACYLWDNGVKTVGNESFGYIDHGTGQYINYTADFMPAIVNAATDPDPAYSLETIYKKAPK